MGGPCQPTRRPTVNPARMCNGGHGGALGSVGAPTWQGEGSRGSPMASVDSGVKMGRHGDGFDHQGSLVEGGKRQLTQQHKESVTWGSNSMKASWRRGLTMRVGWQRWRLRNLPMAAIFSGGGWTQGRQARRGVRRSASGRDNCVGKGESTMDLKGARDGSCVEAVKKG
jgi:hypothetical protein